MTSVRIITCPVRMDPLSNIPWTAQSEYRALPSVVLLSRRWWLFFFVGGAMDKKICVVSMSVGKPASMTAAWINNELIMAERTSYPERRRDMELQLLRELREKEEKGFIVLVEEENSFITGRVGQRVRLRDPFMNGRPVLIEANNNVVSADYIRTMTDTVTKQDNEYSPYEPFVNMIKAFYRMELTKVPQGKLTGKDNIF